MSSSAIETVERDAPADSGAGARRFAELLGDGRQGYSFPRLDARLRWVFDGVPLAGRRLLEIGSGDGTFACWCRIVGGAASVTGLEPEASGSRGGVLDRFRQRVAELGLTGARVLPATFQAFEDAPGSYDVILSYASINHLSEPDCVRLHHDAASRAVYLDLFRKMHDLLTPGGDLLVTDCSRHNLFAFVHRRGWLRNPWQPHVEWDKHQPPSLWAELLREAGFTDVSWRWSRLTPLGFLGPLASNALFGYVTTSGFDLRAKRPAGGRESRG